jgi:hypothetical protein
MRHFHRTTLVPADALAVARGRQVVKERWAADFRARMASRNLKKD